MKNRFIKLAFTALIAAFTLTAAGCIIVSEKTHYEEIELKKAQAQYLTARADIERINLEREKAGLPRLNVTDCDGEVHVGDPVPPAPAQ